MSSRPLGRLAYATYRFLETTMLSEDTRYQIMRARDRWRVVDAKSEGTIAQAVAFVLGGGVV